MNRLEKMSHRRMEVRAWEETEEKPQEDMDKRRGLVIRWNRLNKKNNKI